MPDPAELEFDVGALIRATRVGVPTEEQVAEMRALLAAHDGHPIPIRRYIEAIDAESDEDVAVAE